RNGCLQADLMMQQNFHMASMKEKCNEKFPLGNAKPGDPEKKQHPSTFRSRGFPLALKTGSLDQSFMAPKSGDIKGTIRSDVRLPLLSNDIRRHRLISISYI